MKRIERVRRDESGMTYVFIGFSMMAFISASALAIDVGMLMTARSQAQNSADAVRSPAHIARERQLDGSQPAVPR